LEATKRNGLGNPGAKETQTMKLGRVEDLLIMSKSIIVHMTNLCPELKENPAVKHRLSQIEAGLEEVSKKSVKMTHKQWVKNFPSNRTEV
jgi:hypothetical protein